MKVPGDSGYVPGGSGRFRVGSAFYIHPLMIIWAFSWLIEVYREHFDGFLRNYARARDQ